MDSENKQRVSIYMDKDLVAKADLHQELAGCDSRNEFFARAIENYIADLTLQDNSEIIIEKLAAAIAKATDDGTVKISKGLFRYAVEVEVIMKMLSMVLKIDESKIKDMRKEAINNVRRTRGKVRLDSFYSRKDYESL